jgi:lipopolysaccharide transport system ATP-binding protein
MSTVISIENLSKSYRLGTINSGTLREDLDRWWAKARKRAGAQLKIGEEHRPQSDREFWALEDIVSQDRGARSLASWAATVPASPP